MGYIAPGAACVEEPRRLPNAFPPMKSATSHKMQDGRIFLRLGLWLAVGGTLAAGLLNIFEILQTSGVEPLFCDLTAERVDLPTCSLSLLRVLARTKAQGARWWSFCSAASRMVDRTHFAFIRLGAGERL
jgi:hypothetical protein